MSTRRTKANRPARMAPAIRQRVEAELASGNDLTDPAYLFSTTATVLLQAINEGLIDPVQLARRELAKRGLDADGRWVGFERARQMIEEG